MGQWNSQLTRVLPFFQALVKKDPLGTVWLPELLAITPNASTVFGDLSKNPGLLHPVDLQSERSVLPPKEFLRWLILNPEKMTWPNAESSDPESETQRWRNMLRGHGMRGKEQTDEVTEANRQAATREAIEQLERFGPAKSNMKWWAFEGSTSIDCYLATDRLRIYIEGKRKEPLTPRTVWYSKRNQLMRNLESARADADGMPFGCLLITEEKPPNITKQMIENSLPHLTEDERSDVMRHYLGGITWRRACEATGIDYDTLPVTV
jgi:hypothetical protein